MKNKKILIPLIIVLVGIIALLVGTSYAYFTSNITGNDTANQTVITSGNMRLALTDGQEISLNNAIPGDSVTKTFSVENTGTLQTTYDVYFSELCNIFADKTDLVYTIRHTSANGYELLTETEVPSTSSKIIDSQSIAPNETQTYEITIKFLNKDEIQDDNQGAYFASKININKQEDATSCPVKIGRTLCTLNCDTDNDNVADTNIDNNNDGICDSGCSTPNAIPTTISLYDTILAAESASITSHGNTAPAFTGVSTTDDGMYKTIDDLGDVYYYRGAVQDNYVMFGGFCWRVVRTNGDHSVRLIYQGTTCSATGDNVAIGKYKFNNLIDDNAYVGYMYGTAGSSTYEATHANTNSSNAKTELENWYATNLSTYDDLIADQIFCNDRKVSTEYSTGLGYGKNDTLYGAYERAFTSRGSYGRTQYPTLICSQAADKFTKTSANGNKKLSQKVGMLTYDEAVMAGGFASSDGTNTNTSYYLNTGAYWWLGSPYDIHTGIPHVFSVGSNGNVGSNDVLSTIGLRPVVSLLPSVQVEQGGEGTQAKPWVIVTQ